MKNLILKLTLLGSTAVISLSVGATENQKNGLFESGQFWELGTHPLMSSSEAFRLESFGDSHFHMSIKGSSDDIYFQTEGPYGYDESDAIAPCSAASKMGQVTKGPEAEFQLPASGVYRVIITVGGRCEELKNNSPLNPRPIITVTCSKNCDRSEITHGELISQLRSKGELNALVGQMQKQMNDYFDVYSGESTSTKQYLKDILMTQLAVRLNAVAPWLQKFLNSNSRMTGDRFPTIPHWAFTLMRHVGEIYKTAPASDETLSGEDFEELLKAKLRGRQTVSSVPGAADIQIGSFPDGALSTEAVTQSRVLARVLNALAIQNPISHLKYHGEVFTDIPSFIYKLISEGHVITIRNEHFYVNFAHLSTQGQDVEWPMWIKTGIKLKSGKNLTIPLGHSQYSFAIHGPIINARVRFFMDPTGTNFYPHTQSEALWSGFRGISDVSSIDHLDKIIMAFGVAAGIMRRNRMESKSLSLNGYGYSGVCNDSTSIIQWFVDPNQVSQYPLARSTQMDKEPLMNDGLDQVLRDLPHDLSPSFTQTSSVRISILKRIYSMVPFGFGDAARQDETVVDLEKLRLIDSELYNQMNEVRQELRDAKAL